MKAKDYFIIGLVAIIVLLFVFNNKIGIELGLSESRVDTLMVEEEVISQQILDSLALIPPLQEKVDSLENILLYNNGILVELNKELEQALKEIEEFTPTEDVQFLTKYTNEIDTTLKQYRPVLTRMQGKEVVVISVERVKTINLICVSHDSYSQERPILLSNIESLEEIKAKQKRQVTALMNTISLQDNRYDNNQEQIELLNQQINLYKKKVRKRTFGTIAVGAIAVGATILILK